MQTTKIKIYIRSKNKQDVGMFHNVMLVLNYCSSHLSPVDSTHTGRLFIALHIEVVMIPPRNI
jgi:hypothetical protein